MMIIYALVLGSLLLTYTALANGSTFVYVESNIQTPNGNSIFAFRRNADGSLTPVNGSPFLTGGAGVQDTSLGLGPYDSDQDIVVDSERRLLFAVNSGSDTIAVFNINSDGSLRAVAGSPFPSGGANPVSVGLSGDILFVVNKNGDFPRVSTILPNYTAFRIAPNGSLSPISGSTVSVAFGSSPTQALVDPKDNLLFGADFLGGLLQCFRFDRRGALEQLAPIALPAEEYKDIPAPRVPLGIITHPQERLLYVGLVTINRLGVYEYDKRGRLTFLRAVPNSGETLCWLTTNRGGTRLYSSNPGSATTSTISVYDLSEPTEPREIQLLTLEGQTNSFQMALSTDERSLFIVSQRASPLIPDGQGNFLHAVSVAPDGTLSEDHAPIPFNLPLGARPQGVAVFTQ
jgi:6-phosphogluconolactonase (cycloisomerase 2 family)